MLTSRGWWFLLFVLTLLAMGGVLVLQPGRPQPRFCSLGPVLWPCGSPGSGARSPSRPGSPSADLELDRELRDDRGPRHHPVGRPNIYRPRPRRLGGSIGLSHALHHRPPAGRGQHRGGHGGTVRPARPRRRGGVGVPRPLPGPGGAAVRGGAASSSPTLRGSSTSRRFSAGRLVLAVLPKLVDAEARQRATKRFNLLPPPGIHRLRRPGSGSELLDLRDYRPGDPPKRIAWKASARRDKLITREFESEVPIRCTLFLDASDAVRLGPPGKNALAGLAAIAATVAQAAAGNRDLVGLAVCDRRHGRLRRPGPVAVAHRRPAAAAGPGGEPGPGDRGRRGRPARRPGLRLRHRGLPGLAPPGRQPLPGVAAVP